MAETERRILDRAHGSFLAQALAALVFLAGLALTVRAEEASLVGALYYTPVPLMLAVAVGLVFLVAVAKGLVLCLRAARRGLPLLPSLSAALLSTSLLVLVGRPDELVLGGRALAATAGLAHAAPPRWAAVHALLCLLLAARWFLVERRRAGAPADPPPARPADQRAGAQRNTLSVPLASLAE